MSFSRVTEEQTLEISRDGSVRFEKSNILDSLYFIRSRVGNECGEKKLQMQPQNRRNIPLQICLFQSRQQNICACNLN